MIKVECDNCGAQVPADNVNAGKWDIPNEWAQGGAYPNNGGALMMGVEFHVCPACFNYPEFKKPDKREEANWLSILSCAITGRPRK